MKKFIHCSNLKLPFKAMPLIKVSWWLQRNYPQQGLVRRPDLQPGNDEGRVKRSNLRISQTFLISFDILQGLSLNADFPFFSYRDYQRLGFHLLRTEVQPILISPIYLWNVLRRRRKGWHFGVLSLIADSSPYLSLR